jgi:hypothetical protein
MLRVIRPEAGEDLQVFERTQRVFRPDLLLQFSFPYPIAKNSRLSYSTGMTGTVHVEVVGLKTSECSPFPCDENRTCGLSGCYLSGKLNDAFRELEKVLKTAYGDRVDIKLTLIDDGVPDHIRTIIEREYPPIPMVLVNGRITRIGRISLDRIKNEIEKEL